MRSTPKMTQLMCVVAHETEMRLILVSRADFDVFLILSDPVLSWYRVPIFESRRTGRF